MKQGVSDAGKMLKTIGFENAEELGEFIQMIAGPLLPKQQNLQETYEKVVHNQLKMSLAPFEITSSDLKDIVQWYNLHN